MNQRSRETQSNRRTSEGRSNDPKSATSGEPLIVSLKTLARRLDASVSAVRRWLKEAGVRPVVVGRGRNGAIRYRWSDIEAWLASLEQVE